MLGTTEIKVGLPNSSRVLIFWLSLSRPYSAERLHRRPAGFLPIDGVHH